MSVEETLQTGLALVAEWSLETTEPEPNRIDVVIDVEKLIGAVTALQQGHWGYLSAITGLDLGVEAGQLEVLYHFCNGAAVLTLRVRISRDDAHVPSVYGVIPSVSFYERELIEMFGVTVDGTPNTDRLFLPDDWPEGVYPLRKDFNIKNAQSPVQREEQR